MDNQTDHQKLMSMKEMIAEKTRKNYRDKIIEKKRVTNPFTDAKKFIQTFSSQSVDLSQFESSKIPIISEKENVQFDNFVAELPLEQEEIGQFQDLTLNSFRFRLSKITASNINSDDGVLLLESIPEFFKENKSSNLLKKFKDEGGLEILHGMIKNLHQLKPITYQIARILEIFSIFAQVEEFINDIWVSNETIDLFLSLCIPNQDQQILEQLFSLFGFLCSDAGIEKRDYIRSTPFLNYVCNQVDKYSMNTYLIASTIVRNGIWLLVSLCSDLPQEGNYDYCKEALHIFIRFLKCGSGTVSQECAWVLETLVSYYISPNHPNQIQNIKDFIDYNLPINLTETFKQNCLTTTQCALQVLKQLLQAANTDELKMKVASETVVNRIIDLLKVQQRLLVFKVLLDFIKCLTQSPQLIQVLIKNSFFEHLFQVIKNPDLRFNSHGISVIQSIINNANDIQLVEIVELGLFNHIKEFLDQSENEVTCNIVGLSIIEQILEAGDSIYSNQDNHYNKFKLKMDQSGLLKNIEDLQLSSKEVVSDKAIQIIERFCLQKGEQIEEETN